MSMPEYIIKELYHAPGEPEPYEHIITEEEKNVWEKIRNDPIAQKKELDHIRGHTGNIVSGALRALEDNITNVTVNYFMDVGPSRTNSVYNKVSYGFYD